MGTMLLVMKLKTTQGQKNASQVDEHSVVSSLEKPMAITELEDHFDHCKLFEKCYRGSAFYQKKPDISIYQRFPIDNGIFDRRCV